MDERIKRFLCGERCAQYNLSPSDKVFMRDILLEFIIEGAEEDAEEGTQQLKDGPSRNIFAASTDGYGSKKRRVEEATPVASTSAKVINDNASNSLFMQGLDLKDFGFDSYLISSPIQPPSPPPSSLPRPPPSLLPRPPPSSLPRPPPSSQPRPPPSSLPCPPPSSLPGPPPSSLPCPPSKMQMMCPACYMGFDNACAIKAHLNVGCPNGKDKDRWVCPKCDSAFTCHKQDYAYHVIKCKAKM